MELTSLDVSLLPSLHLGILKTPNGADFRVTFTAYKICSASSSCVLPSVLAQQKNILKCIGFNSFSDYSVVYFEPCVQSLEVLMNEERRSSFLTAFPKIRDVIMERFENAHRDDLLSFLDRWKMGFLLFSTDHIRSLRWIHEMTEIVSSDETAASKFYNIGLECFLVRFDGSLAIDFDTTPRIGQVLQDSAYMFFLGLSIVKLAASTFSSELLDQISSLLNEVMHFLQDRPDMFAELQVLLADRYGKIANSGVTRSMLELPDDPGNPLVSTNYFDLRRLQVEHDVSRRMKNDQVPATDIWREYAEACISPRYAFDMGYAGYLGLLVHMILDKFHRVLLESRSFFWMHVLEDVALPLICIADASLITTRARLQSIAELAMMETPMDFMFPANTSTTATTSTNAPNFHTDAPKIITEVQVVQLVDKAKQYVVDNMEEFKRRYPDCSITIDWDTTLQKPAILLTATDCNGRDVDIEHFILRYKKGAKNRRTKFAAVHFGPECVRSGIGCAVVGPELVGTLGFCATYCNVLHLPTFPKGALPVIVTAYHVVNGMIGSSVKMGCGEHKYEGAILHQMPDAEIDIALVHFRGWAPRFPHERHQFNEELDAWLSRNNWLAENGQPVLKTVHYKHPKYVFFKYGHASGLTFAVNDVGFKSLSEYDGVFATKGDSGASIWRVDLENGSTSAPTLHGVVREGDWMCSTWFLQRAKWCCDAFGSSMPLFGEVTLFENKLAVVDPRTSMSLLEQLNQICSNPVDRGLLAPFCSLISNDWNRDNVVGSFCGFIFHPTCGWQTISADVYLRGALRPEDTTICPCFYIVFDWLLNFTSMVFPLSDVVHGTAVRAGINESASLVVDRYVRYTPLVTLNERLKGNGIWLKVDADHAFYPRKGVP